FSSWKNPWADLDDEFDGPDQRIGGVLTMRTLLETVAEHPRPIELAIETKHPTRYAGLVERRLVELLDDFGWAGAVGPVRVMSFSWVALRRVRRLTEGLPLVFLMDAPHEWAMSRPFAEPDWIAGPGMALVREHPDLIARIRGNGTRVHVWTVNRPADLRRCLDLGVEAVITDRPAQIRAQLDQIVGPA
ncbi:MAG TPA: glycerophosphodiester phosphodiesterase family protein, partial [Marmoricola sp.]